MLSGMYAKGGEKLTDDGDSVGELLDVFSSRAAKKREKSA